MANAALGSARAQRKLIRVQVQVRTPRRVPSYLVVTQRSPLSSRPGRMKRHRAVRKTGSRLESTSNLFGASRHKTMEVSRRHEFAAYHNNAGVADI
jgi:hypothetical protein